MGRKESNQTNTYGVRSTGLQKVYVTTRKSYTYGGSVLLHCRNCILLPDKLTQMEAQLNWRMVKMLCSLTILCATVLKTTGLQKMFTTYNIIPSSIKMNLNQVILKPFDDMLPKIPKPVLQRLCMSLLLHSNFYCHMTSRVGVI